MPVGKIRLLGQAPRQRRDALDHWLEQERSGAGLPDPAPEERDDRLPSGWWILPAVLLGLPLWGLLIRAVLTG